MNIQAFEWILPLTVLTVTGFCFALLSYVCFFRHIQIRSNIIGSAFFIPLLITVQSHVFQRSLPTSHAVVIGEIGLTVLLLVYGFLLKYRIRLESALFFSVLAGLGLCGVFSSLQLFPFLYQDLRIYLTISAVLSFSMAILNKNTDESAMTGGFAFLGIAQLIGLFESVPAASAVALLLRAYFYLHMLRLLFGTIHEEVMKEVGEARRIQKEFDDELRKEVKKHVFYMEMSQQKMARISQTDALTEAYNRKGIMDQLESLINDRSVQQFSMLIFDIDNFKNINDTLGHPTGDKCLKMLSKIARTNLREVDALGRYGGDEFIILLPGADTDTAFRVAERFRQRISETENPHFTVSIGLATYPADGSTSRELLEHADAGMYISKEKGRNRVSRRMR